MQCYLRLLCYDDPSRKSYTQIHPDFAVDEPPQFGYGQPVVVGPDGTDSTTWPQYIVAYIPKIKPIPNPQQEGKNALLVEVYLAKEEQWRQFEFPDELRGLTREEE